MDLMFVLLFTGVGTVVGAAVVWALMQRKSRPPLTDAELAALKERLQKSDAALAEAASRAEELGQRVSKQDQTLEENREELKARNQQLRMAMQEVEGEITRRCAAEHQMQGLSDQIAVLTEQLKQSQTTSGAQTDSGAQELTEQIARLVGELGEQQKVTEEAIHQRASLEGQLSAEREQIQKLMDETAQTDSGAEQANQSIAALQVELEGEKRQVQELTEGIARLMEEQSEQQKVTEEAIHQRASLEGQLGAERERIQKLMDEIAELQDARSVLDARLTEEKQSAVKRGELLTIAQEKVSLLFHELCADVANGRTPVDHAGASSEREPEPMKEEVLAALPSES